MPSRTSLLCSFGVTLLFFVNGPPRVIADPGAERDLLDVVRELSASAAAGLMLTEPLRGRPVNAPVDADGDAAALETLARVLESEGLVLLEGPRDMRVVLRREQASAWPRQFEASAWVRDRCTSQGPPANVNFDLLEANPPDVVNALEKLSGTSFVVEAVFPTRDGVRLTMISRRGYSLPEACEIYEAALRLVGLAIEERGGEFVIRAAR